MTGPLSIAIRDGIRRVNSAPAVIGGVFVATLATALPAALVVRRIVQQHLGASLAAETAAAGVNYDWWQEFIAQASGIAATFKPSVIGFAAVLRNLSSIADNEPMEYSVTVLVGVYLVIWLFLTGGIVDRYARDRRTRAAGFFAACGLFFFRFLRLAVAGGIVYYVLFAYVHGWLLVNLYGRLTYDMAVERRAFLVRLLLYVLFGSVVVVFNLVFDYAKIRAVVEDRRSMLGALAAGGRFVWRHAGLVLALYVTLALVFVILLAIYRIVAPGAGSTGVSMWLTFLIAQAYIGARLWLKLVFLASGTSLFQQQLAHASYAAAPDYVWPESADIERLVNAAREPAAAGRVDAAAQ